MGEVIDFESRNKRPNVKESRDRTAGEMRSTLAGGDVLSFVARYDRLKRTNSLPPNIPALVAGGISDLLTVQRNEIWEERQYGGGFSDIGRIFEKRCFHSVLQGLAEKPELMASVTRDIIRDGVQQYMDGVTKVGSYQPIDLFMQVADALTFRPEYTDLLQTAIDTGAKNGFFAALPLPPGINAIAVFSLEDTRKETKLYVFDWRESPHPYKDALAAWTGREGAKFSPGLLSHWFPMLMQALAEAAENPLSPRETARAAQREIGRSLRHLKCHQVILPELLHQRLTAIASANNSPIDRVSARIDLIRQVVSKVRRFKM